MALPAEQFYLNYEQTLNKQFTICLKFFYDLFNASEKSRGNMYTVQQETNRFHILNSVKEKTLSPRRFFFFYFMIEDSAIRGVLYPEAVECMGR